MSESEHVCTDSFTRMRTYRTGQQVLLLSFNRVQHRIIRPWILGPMITSSVIELDMDGSGHSMAGSQLLCKPGQGVPVTARSVAPCNSGAAAERQVPTPGPVYINPCRCSVPGHARSLEHRALHPLIRRCLLLLPTSASSLFLRESSGRGRDIEGSSKMMSGKALLVAVLLVGVASRCSGSRGLQGDHIAEQKCTC